MLAERPTLKRRQGRQPNCRAMVHQTGGSVRQNGERHKRPSAACGISPTEVYKMYSRAKGCLSEAIRILDDMGGAGSQRLIDALSEDFTVLREEELPKDLRSDYRSIHDAITRVDAVGVAGQVSATVNANSAEENEKLVLQLRRLAIALKAR